MKKTIEMVMTPNLHSIGAEIHLGTAQEQMNKYGVRHLPVLRAGKVIGMLSDRDIKRLSKFSGYTEFSVEDAMTSDPYVVAPDTPFAEVAETMAERKYGSVIIAEGNKPLGIFTAVDGMRLLAAVYK